MEERNYIITIKRKDNERVIARWDCDKCTEEKINNIMDEIDYIWAEEYLYKEEEEEDG